MRMRWPRSTDWQHTEGTVSQSTMRSAGEDGYEWEVVFTYKVEDHWYGGTFTTSTSDYHRGDSIDVPYDPTDHARNKLVARETLKNRFILLACLLGVVACLVFRQWGMAAVAAMIAFFTLLR